MTGVSQPRPAPKGGVAGPVLKWDLVGGPRGDFRLRQHGFKPLKKAELSETVVFSSDLSCADLEGIEERDKACLRFNCSGPDFDAALQ